VRTLEVIKVRTTGKDRDALDAFLRSLGQVREESLLSVKWYRHASLYSDLAVHFLWSEPIIGPRGSSLALRLAETLGAFGLVDHSVWVEGS